MKLTYEQCKIVQEEIEQGKLKLKHDFVEDTFKEDGITFYVHTYNVWYVNGNRTNVPTVRYYEPRTKAYDYVAGSGTGAVRCTRGRKYGQYAREYANPEYAPWVKSKQKEHGFWYEPWDTVDNTNQPTRSWKRSKIKRQYMKHWRA